MKTNKQKHKSCLENFLKTLLIFLVLLSLFIAYFFPENEPLPVTGSFQILTKNVTFTDIYRFDEFSKRQEYRQVNVTIWYPQTDGGGQKFPLIVFSHGGLGTETSNESLFRELASHGYVVFSIGHPGHTIWTRTDNGTITFVNKDYFRELKRENARLDKNQSFQYYQKWMQTRMNDINFVLDTLISQSKITENGIYSLIDKDKIGLIGHSLGGSAVLGLPRERDDIDVVIALESPYLYDIVGVDMDKFLWNQEAFPTPVLNIYSDASWDHLTEWSQYQRNVEMLKTTSVSIQNVHLTGGGHFSLTDLSLVSPTLVQFLERNKTSLTREEYLKNLDNLCLEFFSQYLY